MSFNFPPRRRKRSTSSLCSRTPTSPEHHTFPLGLTVHYGSSWAQTGLGHHPPPTTLSPALDPFKNSQNQHAAINVELLPNRPSQLGTYSQEVAGKARIHV